MLFLFLPICYTNAFSRILIATQNQLSQTLIALARLLVSFPFETLGTVVIVRFIALAFATNTVKAVFALILSRTELVDRLFFVAFIRIVLRISTCANFINAFHAQIFVT
jgi:hypothetical protein